MLRSDHARLSAVPQLLGTMSAIGTALGPSLGGVLIAGLDWRAIFLVNLPLGILTLLLAYRYLYADRQRVTGDLTGFDTVGTLLLALTLAAHALAMTIGRGSVGPLNIALPLLPTRCHRRWACHARSSSTDSDVRQ